MLLSKLRHVPHRLVRYASTDVRDKVKVLVVGAGSGGLSVANQIYNRFASAGQKLSDGDVAIIDPAEFHHYQPGWTLVGSGLKNKTALRRRVEDLIPSYISHAVDSVTTFTPKSSSLTTASGRTISYDILVVAAGIKVNFDAIEGLPKALADPTSAVSSIYSYDTCDKTWGDIEAFRSGKAVFTQPAGVIKCAGAPQKIMWMAWDRFRQTNRGQNVDVEFWTGMPTMFSVPKYSKALNELREQRGIRGEFEHNLVSVDSAKRIAKFKKPDGSIVETDYAMLHVTPPMGPLDFIKKSPLADSVGWVDVDNGSLRHKNPEFGNVFALGDCSSLPTSKTAAAITGQAPVLAENVFSVLETGDVNKLAIYDGYTSCPLLTGYGELMLAEFLYGLKPSETFASVVKDQAIPRRVFYNLKKDFFPWVYFSRMVKGTWFGRQGILPPKFTSA
ncbi:FAD/NAD-binding domain-containing protein [Sistotremastrum niveocremeum HHB9708]|uniref:Sulfide:quinone oxidoreductase, mitochondrial n=2 Tax=Sistotremastraceae TaxID=3402574 RepID=A0A165AMQ4_9AGAM|nr:FAD/NAD-binding domain-containing protein [Sistotremastrum niveocremeum HHB9708]KZT42124.1 FAD/NAD(P)-binding domain-containing protein [Sistotremastrum suecicum HHB10207 ss-3]